MDCENKKDQTTKTAETVIDDQLKDPTFKAAVVKYRDVLKAAGVTSVRLWKEEPPVDLQYTNEKEIILHITPEGGDREASNAAMRKIKDELEKAGVKDLRAGSIERCASAIELSRRIVTTVTR